MKSAARIFIEFEMNQMGKILPSILILLSEQFFFVSRALVQSDGPFHILFPFNSVTYFAIPDYHRFYLIIRDTHLRLSSQHSSQYLPVAPPSAASSRASSQDDSKRAKDTKSRPADSLSNPKRRSTMNSRDAAYDEEEQLRRAIEESKEDTKSIGDDIAMRRGKRSRSDSEA